MASLAPGNRLGPYEILSPLGEGGMGQVWKARDTRLDRIVAIKTSQAKFSERFEREARAVAALNHPNICQLYDVGPDYLVMEFVEGAPIAPLDSIRKLLDLAVQIADGLAAAHAANIVHRDLKPDNILVTREGRVKILDFGLAKAAPAQGDATLTMGITDPGTTIGTVNYMSPEQARGEPNLTPQSDQFSFGLVLYEMLAGKRPFQRGSAAETMTAIIREDAEPLPASTPAPLRWIVERLLSKDPAERYDSTRDLYRELRQIRERLSGSTSAMQAAADSAPKRQRVPALVTGIVGLACLVLGGGAAWFLLPAPAADLSHYKFTPISQDEAEERSPQWSPDGKSIAFVRRVHGIMQIFTRNLGSEAAQLTNASQDCGAPFWSPDGATVYYLSGGDLWSVPASGGTAQMVLEKIDAAALHPDGKTVVFARDGKLWSGSLKGGEAKEFWAGPGDTVVGFNFSPDGSKLALGSFPSSALWILPFPSGTPRKLELTPGTQVSGASWFPDNRHLAVADLNALYILDTADGSRRAIASSPDGWELPSVSPDGKRIAYMAGQIEWDVLEISIPDGGVRTIVSGGGVSWLPDWAPSGAHFLFSRTLGGGPGIVDQPAAGEGFSRRVITADQAFEPHWSPEGTRFVYLDAGPVSRLMLANASSGQAVLLHEIPTRGALPGMSWSPDGEWISYLQARPGGLDLAKIRATPGATPEILAQTANVRQAYYQATEWSPAGDWIAYPAADRIYLISPDGKSTRKLTSRKFSVYSFSKDGKQLYGVFQNTTGNGAQWQLYSVDVKSGAEKLLAPIDLPASVDSLAGFSIHPDGKRFLTSIAKWPYDIWMLEGFDQPQSKSLLDRLLRR